MYVFRLYLSGETARSEKAIEDLKKLLEANFKGQYSLEIINVIENWELAESDKVIATPTVVKTSPPPMRRVVGDLGKKDSVLEGLGLEIDDCLGLTIDDCLD